MCLSVRASVCVRLKSAASLEGDEHATADMCFCPADGTVVGECPGEKESLLRLLNMLAHTKRIVRTSAFTSGCCLADLLLTSIQVPCTPTSIESSEMCVLQLRVMRENDPTAKALVFSQFVSTIEWLKVKLAEQGFSYRTISGSMSLQQRSKVLKAHAGAAASPFSSFCDDRLSMLCFCKASV